MKKLLLFTLVFFGISTYGKDYPAMQMEGEVCFIVGSSSVCASSIGEARIQCQKYFGGDACSRARIISGGDTCCFILGSSSVCASSIGEARSQCVIYFGGDACNNAQIMCY